MALGHTCPLQKIDSILLLREVKTINRSGDRDPREIRKLTQVSNGKLCTKVTGDRMQKL
jgi:hypothetical protein